MSFPRSRPEMIPIQPTPVTTEITQISVTMRNFELNSTEGTAVVLRFDKDGRFVDTKEVPIPPDVYATWGTDDDVIISYVTSKLNVTRMATPSGAKHTLTDATATKDHTASAHKR